MSIQDYYTLTKCKELFFLNDNELSQIKYIDCRNPHHRQSLMKLYHKNDVLDFLKNKYETNSMEVIDQHIQEIKQIKDERKQKRLSNKQSKKEKRKYDLLDALNQYGLTLRSDSKLCKGYLEGKIKDTKSNLDFIVERMCQMKYLFEYCDMKNEIEKAKKEQQEEWNDGYFPDISVFDHAELNILRRINTYPKIFPWMENRTEN
jgi:hypothetical protein